jgi:hypothetical protein
VYLGVMLALAAHKWFWYDELFTYYIATMPSLADIRHALEIPLDNHPIEFYLVTRAALDLLGNEHVAARLPGIVGLWLAALCLFVFVARRTNALYGVVAMVSLFVTLAARYAYEARPYGLALGLSALALTTWQGAADGQRRTLSLIGLALALAGVVSTSYYASLVIVPIAAAELLRTRDRGKIDWPIWAAFGVGVITILLHYWGFVRGIERFSVPTWASPYKMVVIDMYRSLFGNFVLVLVGVLAAFPLYASFRGRPSAETQGVAGRFVRHEIVAAVGFLLMPLLGTLAAVLVVNAITARYVLSTALGFSILLAFTAFRAMRSSAVAGIAFVFVVAAIGAVGVAFEWYTLGNQRAELEEFRELLSDQPADLPIVISSPIPAWELMHYERPETAARLYYVVPRPTDRSPQELAAWHDRQTWLKLPRYFPVQAEELPLFVDSHRRFLFLDSRTSGTRRLRPLLELGAALELVAAGHGLRLYMVDANRAAGGAGDQGTVTPRDRTRGSLR